MSGVIEETGTKFFVGHGEVLIVKQVNHHSIRMVGVCFSTDRITMYDNIITTQFTRT